MSAASPAPSTHLHAPAHLPPSGTGWAVCECGATLRVEQGKPVGDWHACPVCSHEAG